MVWPHRWEHDKGPEGFFNALYELDAEGADFSLIVLGEAFERRPNVFEKAKKRLGRRIIHFGYAKERAEYARLLRLGTVAVSTSLHEFFGISVLEAVRAGARPLLPRRLSYPELFPDRFLYEDNVFLDKLRMAIEKPGKLSQKEIVLLTEPHSWQSLRQRYIDWIAGAG